jgi:hypothetical protein
MDPITAAFNIGGKIIDALKGFGIIPDKDMELKVQATVQNAMKEAQDFFLAFFTATIGKDEPWYSPNKLFRPVCSFIVVAFYIYARLNNMIVFSLVVWWAFGLPEEPSRNYSTRPNFG